MLKAVRRSFSMKLGNRVFVCLDDRQMPPALKAQVKPFVFCGFAFWTDQLNSRENPAQNPVAELRS